MTDLCQPALASAVHPLRRTPSWVVLAMVSACGGEVDRPVPADLSAYAIEETLVDDGLLPVGDGGLDSDPSGWAVAPSVAADDPIAPAPKLEVAVRSGENLVLIAEWSGVSVEVLAELNGIDVRDPLRLEQRVIVPVPADQADAFVAARQGHADARLSRYLDGRGGLIGLADRVVRTGETAWGIAADEGLPIWVVAAYNRDAQLDRLYIGDTLVVPVMGDTVSVADDDASEIGPEP